MSLKENYKDDILDVSVNTKRKYRVIENADGTISLDDETVYIQEGDNFGADDINTVNTKVNTVEDKITADDDLVFDFTKSGSEYGYKDANGNFIPFKTTHTDTYTYPSGSTGGTYDMGVKHQYRYVNATNVYNKGKADGGTTHTETYTASTRGASLDMGADHKYRYVNTNGVPNSNSGTKTITSSDANWLTGNVDMGATNSYRYVNATNVYAKGKLDGVVPTYISAPTVSSNKITLTGLTNGKSYLLELTSYGSSKGNLTATIASGATQLLNNTDTDDDTHSGTTFKWKIQLLFFKATATTAVFNTSGGGSWVQRIKFFRLN